MKNKRKSILVIFIIFFVILGLSYYTNAAETLKALQDKYKISYNNLTKALKEGTDQERIDQLSEQCKEDYAKYQKAAKGSGGFDNKTNMLPAKSNSMPKKYEIPFEAPVSLVQFKQIKIKVNGKDKLVNVPFINQEFAKKNPPDKRPARITEKPAPRRIGGPKKGTKFKKSGKYYEVPCSYEVFGYPLDDTDKFRVSGEEKIYDLYCLVAAQTADNYGDGIVKIMELQQEILEKYGKYPDICAAAQLYGSDSFEKYMKDTGNFKYLYSTSFYYFRYSQLGIQYDHLKNSNEAMKTILGVFEDRKKEIKANNQALIEQNKEYEKAIKTYTLELKSIKDAVHGKPNQQATDGFASDIANKYSAICYSYSQIYNNLMQANEKKEADSILKVVKKGETYKLSGKLYDMYSEIPPELPFKYLYTDCASVNNPTKLLSTRDCPYGEIINSGEVKVKMYRDADKLLQIVRDTRHYQTLDKEDTIEIDGRSRNERRTLEFCDYINTFKPESEAENPKVAPEKINEESLIYYKEIAYNNTGTPEYSDFYKRKPYIKELYFSSNENTKLPETGISLPEENSTIRASIDYEKPLTPDYAIQAKIYTLKTSQPETDPPSGPVAFNKSKSELQIDRQKFVTLIPDSLYYGYYANFFVNDKNYDEDTSEPVKAKLTKKVKDKYGKIRTETTWPWLVKKGKNVERESICCIRNNYDKNQSVNALTKSFYLNNKYFVNHADTLIRNIRGLFNNIYDEANDIIIPTITLDTIKCGGMQWVFATSYNCMAPVQTTRHLYRNQADWLIIDAHGSVTNESGYSGGVAIADTVGNLDFSVSPKELIKDFGTPKEKSEYAEDVDVLILLACSNLKLHNDANIFARGWHKLIPEGIILGFQGYTADDLNKYLIEELNSYLNVLAKAGKKATFQELKERWRLSNENCYIKYEANKNSSKFVNLILSKGATVILGNKRYTYEPVEDSYVTPKIWRLKEINIPDQL